MKPAFGIAAGVFATAFLFIGAACAQEMPVGRLGLPVRCEIGKDCFVQQLPDMDQGPAAADPFCRGATYDGHDGVDIRLRSMRDVEGGVPVVAVLAGTVRNVRDGVEDHVLRSAADRAAITGRECGNGVVIAHPGGMETQYCHLRRNSVAVKAGQAVEGGQVLGEIGASGLAQFPHVHLSVRIGGRKYDPVSGRELSAGCGGEAALSGTFFTPEAAARFSPDTTAFLGIGLAGAPVDFDRLVEEGGPATAPAGAPATLNWAWLINLRKGDVIRSKMVAPDGQVFFEGAGQPLDRDKATYLSFLGRKQVLKPGAWTLTVEVLRDGASVASDERTVDVR